MDKRTRRARGRIDRNSVDSGATSGAVKFAPLLLFLFYYKINRQFLILIHAQTESRKYRVVRMEETWKRESRILQEKRVLAFFGKSEKVLAPRKKEKEREGEGKNREHTESMDIGQWCTVVENRGTKRMDDRDFGRNVTLNGKMEEEKKKKEIAKFQNFPNFSTFGKKHCLFNPICRKKRGRGKRREKISMGDG